MNVQTLDHLMRSRKTILDILAKRGYNTKPYERFGYEEVEAMAKGGSTALRMDLERPAEATDTGIIKCRVEYYLKKMKLSIEPWLSSLSILSDDDPEAKHTADTIDPKTTEIIVMLVEDTHPMADIFHAKALDQYNKRKLRISFFLIDNLVNNPAEHVLVPKHERVPLREHAELLKKLYAEKKGQLPWIVFHVDIQARILGLVPKDIVKITRPSPSAGYYVEYRVCAP